MKNKSSFKCLTNSRDVATKGYRCLTNSRIKATENYSFCTQCMDMPIVDKEGYCEICSDLVDDDKIDSVIQEQLKAHS